jgi:hypothetical protein
MTRSQGLVRWIALAVFSVHLNGQTATPARRPVKTVSVDESTARAFLTQDSVRVHLPLRSAAPRGLRASARLLSPENDGSGAVATDVSAGARAVDLELPLPKNKSGDAESRIGWYRIAYRLDNADGIATRGILAIGAITPNLMELRLARAELTFPGKPLSIRVFAVNPVTQRPFRDVSLKATLEYDDPASKLAKPPTIHVFRAARTGASGETLLAFPMPSKPGLDATIKVLGTFIDSAGNKTNATVESDIELLNQTGIEIETDKPLHKPGETVHLRALVFDGARRAVDKTKLTLTIYDPDSKTLSQASVETDRFGIASYDWKTDSHLATGDYQAEFAIDDSSSGWSGSSREALRIEHYDLPEFTVTAAMDKGYYTQGQQPVVHVHAGYLFGKAVTQGQVRIVRVKENRWDSAQDDQAPEPEKTAALDPNGDAVVTLDPARDFAELKNEQYRRYADVRYRATVTDASAGRSEPRNFSVRLTRYPVHIYLNRIGDNGREGDFIITTSYADGTPARCRLTLDWMDKDSVTRRAASVATNQYGIAKVRLRYPANAGIDQEDDLGLRIAAKDPEGRTSLSDETVRASDEHALWVELAHTLLKPNQPIEAIVHAQRGSSVDIDVLSDHGPLGHERIHMGSDAEPITIHADGTFHGLVTLWAYQFDSFRTHARYSSYDVGQTYRSVLYPEDRELKVKLTGLEQSYLPGAEVNAGLTLRAGTAPSAGAFGVSVFDEAVEQRAQTEQEQNQPWYGAWWEGGENVGGVSLASLNRTDMSQEVPDDLDLAAEAVLQFTYNVPGSIEAEDYDEERSSYSSMMEKTLAPVGDALRKILPARFPESAPAIENITRAADIPDSVLLDPWNTPYRAHDSLGSADETLEFESAGPDKLFGTEDDFSIEAARRNLFAVPGEQLSTILTRIAASGRPLPANVAELKSTSRSAGLDLDATLDPNGKPYRYELAVHGSWYLVHVFRQAQGQEKAELSSQSPLWTSSYIDYFAPTQQRMRAALDAWTASGHSFPDTQAEAKAAFAAGGIDADALHDPLGGKLQVAITRLMTYTRLEHVSAGAGGVNSATNKPVTQVMQAVQVVHPTDAAEQPTDLVAQVLHPLTEQSGSDLKPVAADDGTFNANTGAIGGTVIDPAGAIIPDAKVIIKSADATITIATVQTMANGMYLAKDLAAGVYTVVVQSPGFVVAFVRDVSVHAYALTTVDVKLQVGATTDTVTVSSTAGAMLTTESASLATTFKGKQGTDAQAHISSPDHQFTPRLRHIFVETAFWAPSIETSPNGRAGFHFGLPDSLTTWKIHALASTTDGRVAAFDQTFRTFQPLFVDLDVPQVLTVGDELQLPATLRNYTQHDLDLPVNAQVSDWMTLTTLATAHAHVAANGFASPVFGVRAVKPIEAGSLRIIAADTHQGDAVEKTIRVHPDGEPLNIASSGLLRGRETRLVIDLPADAMPGATHATLLLYPNLGSQLVQAMKAALERPHGCAEQIISSTYPSLLYLELSKAARTAEGKPDADVEAQAKDYLQQGYTQLVDYFDASGGLTYWGRKDHTADAALTAYSIEFLNEAAPYIEIDTHYLRNAMGWLIRSQKEDGSWPPRYGNASTEENLYIALTLSGALSDKSVPDDLRKSATQAIARATAWAAASASAVHDPYVNALRLLLDPKNGAALRNDLSSVAVRDKNGLHWSEHSYSPFYSWGRAGDIETTALVLTALQQGAQASDSLEDDVLLYLLGSKDSYGTWMSGQATARVLKALLPLAIAQLNTSGQREQIGLAINGQALTGADAEGLRADPTLLGAPRSLDISAQLRPGHNELLFTGSNDATLASVSAAAEVYVPWRDRPQEKATQTGKDAGLDFGYTCATSGSTGKAIDCTVDARRFGSSSYGMLLAAVGLPPGADVDRVSLGKLIDAGTFERYELEPDRIVFYLWPWRAEGKHFSFRFTPRYAVHAKAAPAKLEDYYNPDLYVVLAPQTFFVPSVTGK